MVNKTPEYLSPLYPFRAVGEQLNSQRLDDETYIKMSGVLYELKCPNPECIMSIRTQGVNLKAIYDHIKEHSGCPLCKLQFGDNDIIGYHFKEGEIPHDIPKNNGRWDGFIVRQVIKIPEEVFEEYSQKLFNKNKNEINNDEADIICETYFKTIDVS